MGRYLIVANQTLGGAELDRTIRDRIEAGHAQFYVVIPMIEPEYEATAWVSPDPAFGMPARSPSDAAEAMEEAQRRSERRLDKIMEMILTAGGDVDGEVGRTDPAEAVRSVLERHTFDEVIVSTLPARLSRWLKMDLPSRVSRMVEVPVTTVEAEE